MSYGRGGQGVAGLPRACEGGAGMVVWDGVEVRGCRGVCYRGVAGVWLLGLACDEGFVAE